MVNIPIILLAAGGSERMGTPKPLLAWGGQTLIEYQAETMLATAQNLFVVLGAYADQIRPYLQKFGVNIIVNPNWEQGMGTSISCGMQEVTDFFPDADAVMTALIDQPLVSTAHLLNLIHEFEPGKKQIIASRSSEGWKGVPAIFDRFYFPELQKLRGDTGARKLISKYADHVKCVEAGNFLDDMDTMEKYVQLHKRSAEK